MTLYKSMRELFLRSNLKYAKGELAKYLWHLRIPTLPILMCDLTKSFIFSDLPFVQIQNTEDYTMNFESLYILSLFLYLLVYLGHK